MSDGAPEPWSPLAGSLAGASLGLFASAALCLATAAPAGAAGFVAAGVVAGLLAWRERAHERALRVVAAERDGLRHCTAASLAERVRNSGWGLAMLLDGDGGCIVSPSLSALTGRSGAEQRMGAWLEDVHPDDRDSALRQIDAAVRSREPTQLRLRVRHHARGYVMVEMHGVCWVSPGEAIAYLLFGSEVSADRDPHARLVKAMAAANVGYWRLDLVSGRVTWNEVTFDMLSYDSEEFEPSMEVWREILHPDDRDRVLAIFGAALEGTAGWFRYEHRLRTGDGGYLPVLGTGEIVQRDEDGTPLVVEGLVLDLSELRATEVELEFQKQRLEVALDAGKIGMWDWLVSNGDVFFSRTYYTMLGYKPGAFPASLESFQQLIHPDDRSRVEEAIGAHFADLDTTYRCEFRALRADGTYTTVLTTGRTVDRAPDGSPSRMAGVHVDVDDQRRAREAAQAANRAKSEFLANMSHEIRTPMTAILGYIDVLDDWVAPRADAELARDAVAVMRRNAAHLLAIINDILDMSKIESGRMSMERIATDLPSIVLQVTSFLQTRAAEKGIALEAVFDTDVPQTITTDPTRLRQILLNLLGNAAKFTESGSVTMRVALRPDDAAPLQFAIEDTGIGMTPEQRDLVATFDAFTQADTSMTRRFGGTGLGLRISSSFAEMLGGEVRVASELGVGSTFTLCIDPGDLTEVAFVRPEQALLCQEDRSEDARPEELGQLRGMRILLAEDGIDNQKLLSFHLRQAGADVVVASHGREAMDLLAAGTPVEALLMDMQMPVLDGYQATGKLREQGCTLPVIALTAHAMAEDRRRCLDAGCDDYLTKPVDREALITCVRDWVLRARERPSDRPGPLRSAFADDADLAGIVVEFVEGLPERVASLREALAAGEHERLLRGSHKLKGAGGGYGFPEITNAARQLEQRVAQEAPEAQLQEALEALAGLCDRALRGLDPTQTLDVPA